MPSTCQYGGRLTAHFSFCVISNPYRRLILLFFFAGTISLGTRWQGWGSLRTSSKRVQLCRYVIANPVIPHRPSSSVVWIHTLKDGGGIHQACSHIVSLSGHRLAMLLDPPFRILSFISNRPLPESISSSLLSSAEKSNHVCHSQNFLPGYFFTRLGTGQSSLSS